MTLPQVLKSNMEKEEFWHVDVFSREGFKRQKCKKCGTYFWSIVERETCGEPPCGDYSFIGSPVGRKMELEEVEETFLKWFEKNGHTIVNRYPVVARWKPDTFFTGASIYCFQPFVVSGEVEPPANPLVIAQPSVRFVDIENVGLGTGRHLTSFTMGGHHAFNKEREIYWRDKTVELCYNFFTREMKIPPEELVFKESWWEGGGNAGPCFEVIVRGNEVATLVFMEYLSDGLKKMNTRVVDTGYGLERIVWLTKGTKTIYDAIFPELISELKKRVEESRFTLHNIYQLIDHTKTIMFILGDGVVPSNVREGYLARLLIRRSERAIRNLGLDLKTHDLVERQIQIHRKRYPEFWKERESILKLVRVEEEKYEETLKRGRNVVKRIVAGSKGKGKIDEKTLIMLYDSHGLLPSDVKRFAEGFPVEGIDDVEAKLAVRKETKKVSEKKFDVDVSDIPETKILYYDPVYEWKAKVLAVRNGYLILDRSAFYPRSGGQEPDHGVVISNGRTLRIVDVEKVNNVILHRVEGDLKLKKDDVVLCKIDKDRRKQLTQHHTATHLVNAACRKILGNWVWQNSAFKDVDKARLDITHYQNLTDEEIEEVEKQVREWIKMDLPVEKRFMLRNEAEKRYGFRLYQGGVPIGKEIRVVSVDDIDHEACGGTHCDSTGEIGKFYILNTERIQDGVVRINFVAGAAAEKFEEENRKIVEEVSKILSVDRDRILDAVENLLKQKERMEDERRRAMIEDVRMAAEELKDKFFAVDDVSVLIHEFSNRNIEFLKNLSRMLTRDNTLIVLFSRFKEKILFFVSKGEKVKLNLKQLVDYICSTFNGKGGASEFVGQGFVKTVNMNKLRDEIWKILK